MTAQKMAIGAKVLAGRTIRFVGSDESVDRDGDVIQIDGWDLTAYMKNPVVLYGHNYYDLPVGRASVVVDKRARQLLFDIKFPTIEELSSDPSNPSEHALRVDAIYNMAKAGILNTVSVGFRGLESEPSSTGRIFKKQELLEVSIVPVPANSNAVVLARSANVPENVIKGLMPEGEKMAVEKAGRRLSKESRSTLETLCADVEKAASALRAFITADDEPEGEEPEEAPEGEPEKAASVPESKDAESVEKYVVEIVEKDSASAT